MTIQAVNAKNAVPNAAGIQNTTQTANAAQSSDMAFQAFANALGRIVSFQAASTVGLPSISSAVQINTQQPQYQKHEPSQTQDSNQPQQQETSAPVVQQVVSQVSKSTPVRKAEKSADNNTQDTQDQTTQTKDAPVADPTANTQVVAQVAQQFTQVAQNTVQTTNTAVVSDQSQQQNSGQPQQQQVVNNGPQGPQEPTGPVVNQGPVQAQGPVQQTDHDQAQNDKPQDFQDLIQSSNPTTQAVTGPKIKTGAAQQSVKDQQAQDMAASLNDTGANLSIKVAVQTASQTKSDEQNADAGPQVQGNLGGLAQQNLPSDHGAGHDGGGQQDFNQLTANSTLGTASATPNQTMQPQVFAAAMAAQASASQMEAEAPVAPQQQGVTGVAAMGAAEGSQGTQSSQNAKAPQAPQAPVTPRSLQQAQVAEQVSVQIAKQVKEGVDKISIKLNPQELGRVEVHLEVNKDGTVQATVFAENKDTLAMLQKDADALAKALSNAGLSTDAGSMNFNLRGDGQQQQFAGNGNSQGNGGGNDRAARWAALNNIAEADPLGSAVAATSSSGLSALDVRV